MALYSKHASSLAIVYATVYLDWSFVHRYALRVQGMQLRLEFVEKKEELQPALDTLHKAIDGNIKNAVGDGYSIYML